MALYELRSARGTSGSLPRSCVRLGSKEDGLRPGPRRGGPQLVDCAPRAQGADSGPGGLRL
jgi:hypothetical protein